MENRRLLFSIGVLIFGALLSGCTHLPTIPSPNQPITSTEPAVENSVINLPISISMSPLATQINATVPTGEDHDRGNGDWIILGSVGAWPLGSQNYGYRYRWERTPISINMNSNTIETSTEIHYLGRGGIDSPVGWTTVCCGCDTEWPRRITVGLTTTFNWNDNWSIDPHTTAMPVNAPNHCLLTAANFDVTNKLASIVQNVLNNAAANVDNYLRSNLNFRQNAESAWQAIQSPIPVSNDINLLLSPEAVQVSPINGTGNQVNFSVGLIAKPKIIKGDLPPLRPQPLPNLSTATPGNNFHIVLEGEVQFNSASSQLAENLEGRMYIVGEKKVFIEKVRLYGSGDSAVLEVKVRVPVSWWSSLRGTIYLTGVPAYDSATRTLFIQNLDYTLETRNKLANVADWLLHDGLRRSLADQSRWYIGDKIDDQRVKLQQALNRDVNPNMRISGNIAVLRPLSVGMTATSLRAVVISDGTAELAVH